MSSLHEIASDLPQQTSVQPKHGYRADVDGLRAIAVASVVAYHIGIPLFRGGFVGVDIFFVISGYLICSLINKEIRGSSFNFARFYGRRAKRILPALYVLLAIFYIVACGLLSPLEAKEFAQNALATLLSGSNIRFWLTTNYFSPNSELNPLLMTWSLGVEEQFYIVFPILMYCMAKLRQRTNFLTVLIVCCASFVFSVWDVKHHPSRAFYLPTSRTWELGTGTLLALYQARRKPMDTVKTRWLYNVVGLAGFATILFAIGFYDKDTLFPGAAALLPVLGTVFFILAEGSIANKILSTKPIVFVGLISYSWYLWHWPMLSFARVVSIRELPVTTACVIGLASFGMAVLSYRYIEQPFRRSTLRNRPLLLRYGAASLVMMVPALLLYSSGGWPQRFNGISTIEKDTKFLSTDPCLAPYGKAAPNLSDACVSASIGQASVALLGDSHAAAIAGSLKALASTNNMGFYQLTKASCEPLADVSRWMPSHPQQYDECAAFNINILRTVEADKNIRVVVVAGYWASSMTNAAQGERYLRRGQGAKQVTPQMSKQNLELGINALVEKLEASGKKVILVEDEPSFNFDPRRYVLGTYIPMRQILGRVISGGRLRAVSAVPREEAVSAEDRLASGMIESLAKADPRMQVFDPKSDLCDQTLCYFLEGNSLLYDDSQHLSPQGAERALKGLRLTYLNGD